MSRQVDLACTVCGEEFLVPIGVYRAYSGVVPCPCCGCTDLVLLGERQTGESDQGTRGSATGTPVAGGRLGRLPCDPVCGRELAEHQAQLSVRVEGDTYVFCSELCRALFSARPGWFLERIEPRPARRAS